MAVVWANNGGSGYQWNTVTWYYWDEQTQSAQPYGQTPQAGDYVYLNGYEVRFPAGAPINISNGTITNRLNPYTGRSGGQLFPTSSPVSITANFEVYGNYIMEGSAPTKTIVGNVYVDESVAQYAFYKGGGSAGTLTIVGNVDAYAPLYHDSATTYNLRITGELHYHNIASFPKNPTTAIIEGRLIMDYCVFACTTLNINGVVEYKSVTNDVGIRYTTLNILNPDTFTWKDISEPRSNPFFIVTECELNDTYLYPSASVVRDGIQYAANQRTGTYRPDYPIPQNVMKDVEYDSGLLIGTLEFPQVPTTSDIVTAIKNDSDLGGKINTTNTNVGNISTAVTTIDGKVDIIDTNVDTLLSRLTSVLTQRLGQSVTVEILQQILVAHLDN